MGERTDQIAALEAEVAGLKNDLVEAQAEIADFAGRLRARAVAIYVAAAGFVSATVAAVWQAVR